MEIRKTKGKAVQLRRTVYKPVEYEIIVDAEGEEHKVRVPGTGQGKSELLGSFKWPCAKSDLDVLRKELIEKGKELTEEENTQLNTWRRSQRKAEEAEEQKKRGLTVADTLIAVGEDIKGTGLDQDAVDVINLAIQSFKEGVKNTEKLDPRFASTIVEDLGCVSKDVFLSGIDQAGIDDIAMAFQAFKGAVKEAGLLAKPVSQIVGERAKKLPGFEDKK